MRRLPIGKAALAKRTAWSSETVLGAARSEQRNRDQPTSISAFNVRALNLISVKKVGLGCDQSASPTAELWNTFELLLADPQSACLTISNCALGDKIMTIVNIRDYTILENDQYYTQYAQFTLTLNAPATANTTIYYYTQDGTASEDGDYGYDYGSVTFYVGEQTATIDIPIYGDNLIEGDETLKLVVLAGANATLAGNAAALVATGTILDNDDGIADAPGGPGGYALQLLGPTSASATLPTLSVRDVALHEGNSYTSQYARFLVTLDRPATADVTFSYYFQDGTASAANGDYDSNYGTVTIQAGQQSVYISTSVSGDNLIEGNETFRLVLSEISNAVFAGGAPALAATATVIDDDNGTPTLSGGLGAFGIGVASQASASATLPTISVRNTAVYEGNTYSSESATFLVTLDKVATADVTFRYYFEDGTASSANGDFYSSYGTVTIQAGQQSTWISTSVYGDNAIEGNETFGLVLYSAQNAVFAGKMPALRATGTIIDNDNGAPTQSGGIGGFGAGVSTEASVSATLPTVSVHNVSIYEGNSGSEEARFLVTLDKPATANVTFSYAFQDGSASGASGDYYDNYGTVTIAAGQQSTWISTSVYGDSAIEGNQTFNLVLSALQGAKFANNSPALLATGTIIDDDNGVPTLTGGIGGLGSGVGAPAPNGALPVLRVVSTSVNEGDSYDTAYAYVHFLLSAPATTDVTFSYITQDGTATRSGNDYYASNYTNTLTISAGKTSGWLQYSVYGDNAIEGDEKFSAIFSNIFGATFEGGGASAVANIVIRDNDGTGTAGSSQTGPSFIRTFYGTAAADTLNGTRGADLLDGRGGADHLNGGLGDDTYVIDALDTITEGTNAGNDTVNVNFSYTLGANLENVTLLGATNINATGNTVANRLNGNSGQNVLTGGAGADSLSGGGGNDTYVLGSEATGIDKVVDTGGIDTITSTISRSLASYTSTEKLTLLGAGNINGTGNALANSIIGNAGVNLLDGAAGNDALSGNSGNDTLDGGTGNDSLTGGLGGDHFRFNDSLGATNIDRIADFVHGTDKIELENAVFTKIVGTGPLTAAQFFKGVAAHDTDDHIIYNASTGALLYDADGNKTGGVGAIQFAVLTTKPTSIDQSDFLII